MNVLRCLNVYSTQYCRSPVRWSSGGTCPAINFLARSPLCVFTITILSFYNGAYFLIITYLYVCEYILIYSLLLFTRLQRPSLYSFVVEIFIVDAPRAGKRPAVRLGAEAVAPPVKRWMRKAKEREVRMPEPPGPASVSIPTVPRPRGAQPGIGRDTAPAARKDARVELPPPPLTGKMQMQQTAAPAYPRPCSPCLPVTISLALQKRACYRLVHGMVGVGMQDGEVFRRVPEIQGHYQLATPTTLILSFDPKYLAFVAAFLHLHWNQLRNLCHLELKHMRYTYIICGVMLAIFITTAEIRNEQNIHLMLAQSINFKILNTYLKRLFRHYSCGRRHHCYYHHHRPCFSAPTSFCFPS